MTDKYKPPFGTYTSVQVIIAPAKTEINLNLSNFLALLDDGQGGAAHPDFNKISAAERAAIKAEIVAIQAAVTAAPVS